MASKQYWRKKKAEREWTPGGGVSEQELLNRVIVTKALQAYASNKTMLLKTKDGDFEINPRIALDVMKASGKWLTKKPKKLKAPKK